MDSFNKKQFSNLYYLYISDVLTETVKDSQVINWLEILDHHKINANLLVLNTISDFLFRRETIKTKISYAKRKIPRGKIYNSLIIRSKDLFGFSNFLVFFSIVLIFFKPLLSKKTIVVQTRLNRNLKSLFFIKKIFKNRIKLIYDLRGAAAEEYINKLGYSDITHVNVDKVRKNYYFKLYLQNVMISKSDKTICVSKKLKEYVLLKNKDIQKDKIIVIPGSADRNIFFYDNNIRKEFRQKHGIEDKLVFLYSGNLKLFWQIPDYLFMVIKLIQNKIQNAYFIILTPDKDIAEKFIIENSLDKHRVKVSFVELDNLNQYLCGADGGLVFRTNVLTNNVASPTKIPEYLLSGLPLIISERIGDYSDFIKYNGYGLVVNNDTLDFIENIEAELKKLKNKRLEISNNSALYYAKQAHVDKMFNIFEYF